MKKSVFSPLASMLLIFALLAGITPLGLQSTVSLAETTPAPINQLVDTGNSVSGGNG